MKSQHHYNQISKVNCDLIQDGDTLASFDTEVILVLGVVAVQHDEPAKNDVAQ